MLLAQGLVLPLAGVLHDASAAIPPSTSFGTPGTIRWDEYQWPAGAGEPTLGVAWNLGAGTSAMFQPRVSEWRVDWNDAVMPPAATYTDVTSDIYSAGLWGWDPILYTDYQLGRTWAGELQITCAPVGVPGLGSPCPTATGCAVMEYTDDNGATWNPMLDPCALPAWDHESIGSGPWAAPTPALANWPHAVYYCSQQGSMGSSACWISYDGGMTFVPTGGDPDAAGICTGLHGHIRVAPDGTAYLPYRRCGGKTGFAVTTDNGATWTIRQVIYPSTGTGYFDPSIGIGADGTIYVGQAEEGITGTPGADPGAWISVSHDRGATWSIVGTGSGAPPGTRHFNVADALGLKRVQFAEVIAGDADRAAFAFLGSTSTPRSDMCAPGPSDVHKWDMYVAMTYDSGVSWDVQKATSNPVQRGGIWPSGGGASCRNLLDFNDIVTDKMGRVLVGYSDGCTGACAGLGGTASMSTSQMSSIVRQSTGRGLFAAYDLPGPLCVGVCTCPPQDFPEVKFVDPGDGDVVSDPLPDWTGYVDRHPARALLAADAGGPYTGIVGTDIAITGSATCYEGSYTCDWTPLGGSTPTFSPSSTVCGTAVNYPAAGTYTIRLQVTDSGGAIAFAIAVVNVMAATTPPPFCPGESATSILVDDDSDTDRQIFGSAIDHPAGAQEIKCVGADYDDTADAETIEVLIQVPDHILPTHTGASRAAEFYWVSFTPSWGLYAGQKQIVQVHWDNTGAPFACYLVMSPISTSAAHDLRAEVQLGADGDPLCDPLRFPNAFWTGETLHVVLPTIDLSDANGNPPAAGDKLEKLSAWTWHAANEGSWGNSRYQANLYAFTLDPVVSSGTGTGTANIGPFHALNQECTGPSRTGCPSSFFHDDDFSPNCMDATVKFLTASTIGLVASCNPLTPTVCCSSPFMTVPRLPTTSAPALPIVGSTYPSLVAGVLDAVAALDPTAAVDAAREIPYSIPAPLPMAPAVVPAGLAIPTPTLSGLLGALGSVTAALPSTTALPATPVTLPSVTGTLGTVRGLAGALGAGALPTPTASLATPPPGAPFGAPPVAPGTKEFVIVYPDWGAAAVFTVDTSLIVHNDWLTKLPALTPAMNGDHKLLAEWWDGYGTVLLDTDLITVHVAIESTALPQEPGRADAAPRSSDPNVDADSDGVLDSVDNCRGVGNEDQADVDGDGAGNVCDTDRDGDGAPNGLDNCPDARNAVQGDVDADGVGDACDEDMDNDGIANLLDNCPRVGNADQVDQDGDKVGDVCDPDLDGDGVPNLQDADPYDPLVGVPRLVNPDRAAGPRLQSEVDAPQGARFDLGPSFWATIVLGGIVLLGLVAVFARRRGE